MIRLIVKRTLRKAATFEGDPMDVVKDVGAELREAVYRGEDFSVLAGGGSFGFCKKCDATTANHEPRRNQATRRSRGYFTCPICGYVKEGMVLDAPDNG